MADLAHSGTRGARAESSLPAGSLGAVARGAGPAVAGYALPFLLVVYLGLKGGGYDAAVRGEVGVAIWWAILVGAAVGALPATRLTRSGMAALGLFLAFCVWTTLGIAWSESAGRSAAEMGRVSAYLGVFVLACLAQGREGLRRTIYAVAAGLALLGVLAALSRLQPGWFPPPETSRILPATQARLSYPLNYWNAVATLSAIAIPLLLVIGEQARFTATRAIAIAIVPLLSLTAFFTLSRGGAAEIAIGVLALFALSPRRLALLPGFALALLGSGLLIAAATQRDALEAGLRDAGAFQQGDEMLALVIVVCAGVGLVHAAVSLASRHGVGPRLSVSRRTTAIAWAAVLSVALVGGLAAGGGGYVAERWDAFQTPAPQVDDAQRFESFSGSGRVDYWRSAIEAGRSEPLVGIGPGSFEFWWARDAENNVGFARDAHSLYLETFAELGLVGAALLIAFVVAALGLALRRVLAARDPSRRSMLAAASAASVVFFSAAAIDWMWEIPVLPVCALLLLAAVLGPSAMPRSGRTESRFAPSPRGAVLRVGAVALSVAGLIAIAIPLAGATALSDSEAAFRDGAIGGAIDDADRASRIQPYAAMPELQRALLLELEGNLGAATAAAQRATADEPTNWRTWLVLSRLEAKAGDAEASVAAYRRARELNPSSDLFQTTPEG